MSLYRCAACGSANIHQDSQAGRMNYDYKKGILGAIVLGTGGAVAGVGTEKQSVYKCPDCGLTLTYSMPEDMKTLIDLGVHSKNARRNIKYAGVPISWNFIINKYKNVESIDSEEKDNSNLKASVSKDEFDFAVFILCDIGRRFDVFSQSEDRFSIENPMTFEEYCLLIESLCIVIENAEEIIGTSLPEEYNNFSLNERDMLLYIKLYTDWKIYLKTGKNPVLETKKKEENYINNMR